MQTIFSTTWPNKQIMGKKSNNCLKLTSEDVVPTAKSFAPLRCRVHTIKTQYNGLFLLLIIRNLKFQKFTTHKRSSYHYCT